MSQVLFFVVILSLSLGCVKKQFKKDHPHELETKHQDHQTSRETLKIANDGNESVGFANLTKPSIMVLPEKKNEVPINPASFCSGLENVYAISTQDISQEAQVLCPNGSPSQIFETLFSNPYQGQGNPTVTMIQNVVDDVNGTVQVLVGFSIKVPKDPVKVLISEEYHVLNSYDRNELAISFKFIPAARNANDADTAFAVEQLTVGTDNEPFTDTSRHQLKLYRVYPDNFDIFMAARTLEQPTDQFKRSVVLRGTFRDPNDPKSTISVSVLNFIKNNLGEPDNVTAAFMEFIRSDMRTLYEGHVNP